MTAPTVATSEPSPPPPQPDEAQRRVWRARLSLGESGVYYALAMLVAALTIISAATGRPNYLAGQNVANILDQTAFVGIMGIGMTIILISGNFDLSVASVAALSAVVFLKALDVAHPVIAIGFALGAGLLAGLANGLIVQRVGVNAFIVTLGSLTALRGLVLVISDSRQVRPASAGARDVFAALQGGTWGQPLVVLAAVAAAVVALLALRSPGRTGWIAVGVLVAIGIVGLATGYQVRLAKSAWYMLGLAAVAAVVLRETFIGRRLYAVGSNAEAARLTGIRVDRYKIGAFLVTALLSAFVGILAASRFSSFNPTGLQGYELTVIASAVLGGTSLFGGAGSVIKTVIGALIFFTLNNGFNVLNLGANLQGLIEGAVLVVAAATYTVASRRANAAPRVDRTDMPTQSTDASLLASVETAR